MDVAISAPMYRLPDGCNSIRTNPALRGTICKAVGGLRSFGILRDCGYLWSVQDAYITSPPITTLFVQMTGAQAVLVHAQIGVRTKDLLSAAPPTQETSKKFTRVWCTLHILGESGETVLGGYRKPVR